MRIVFVFFVCSIFNTVIAQTIVDKGYFQFPIKPGQTNYLSGSMGELRSNHFHAGIDIKTGGQIGLPVYSSADGYVSRIRVNSFGYGRVLYITHPNGLTTVYAHLDEFNASIANWALKKQYESKSFNIDLCPMKDELIVKKGEIIAKSGNTGSSGGPHLHYEIRDDKENVWNPLLFGFNEIKDNIPPVFDFLALRTFGIGALVENEFGRKEFKPTKIGNKYTLPKSINALGNIGIEVKTHDKMNETSNSYGISCIEVKVNGKETFFHNINTFSFDDGRKINAHIDYETLVHKNQRFQNCYISDGNGLGSYKNNSHNGRLTIEAGQSYKVEIIVYDAYSNNATLSFTIDGKEPSYKVVSTDVSKGGYRVYENILKIKGKVAKDTIGNFYTKGIVTRVSPSYLVNGYPVYLYDLRRGLLDSIVLNNYVEKFDFVSAIPPGKTAEINYDDFKIQFSDTSLLDTMFLQLKCIKDPSGKHCINIHDPSVPVFGKINVLYKPTDGEKIHPNSYLSLNGRKYEETEVNEDALLARTKYLGNFVIVKDTVAPVVKYLTHSTNVIKFNIYDMHSGIESINSFINGEWILMNYEHKKNLIWSEKLDKTKPLKGKFRLEVKDKTGNLKVFEKVL